MTNVQSSVEIIELHFIYLYFWTLIYISNNYTLFWTYKLYQIKIYNIVLYIFYVNK